jgi:NADP-dependent aldehyde dehydrogenase
VTTINTRPVAGFDPTTGTELPATTAETSPEELAAVVERAAAAAPYLRDLGRAGRGSLLTALAQALEDSRERIIAVADSETALGAARLGGELTRTVFQLEFFADVLAEGSYVEATLDSAGPTPMGPRPDLRRMLIPIGPVAVFGASNFPFAFSMPGGDTASALAAGNPVIVKAHGSHPGTSQLIHDIFEQALQSWGAPAGVVGVVFGRKAGEQLVAHPAVKAVGFTGSLSGGRALLAIIDSRPEPIPFYGELSSLNALVVTESAAVERGETIGTGLAASVTGSSGQLCTKPGLVLVPSGSDGDAVVAAAAAALGQAQVIPLLNRRIHESYLADTAKLQSAQGVVHVATGYGSDAGYGVTPMLVTVEASDVPEEAFTEYFGPAAVIIRYGSREELNSVIGRLPASLTASLHVGTAENDPTLVAALSASAGRLVFNGYPTGVAVSWAQHHGGPWPSTNSMHTSVGATAIRRFLRPMTWQDAPQDVLPDELTDQPRSPLPRRIDGRLVLPE